MDDATKDTGRGPLTHPTVQRAVTRRDVRELQNDINRLKVMMTPEYRAQAIAEIERQLLNARSPKLRAKLKLRLCAWRAGSED